MSSGEEIAEEYYQQFLKENETPPEPMTFDDMLSAAVPFAMLAPFFLLILMVVCLAISSLGRWLSEVVSRMTFPSF